MSNGYPLAPRRLQALVRRRPLFPDTPDIPMRPFTSLLNERHKGARPRMLVAPKVEQSRPQLSQQDGDLKLVEDRTPVRVHEPKTHCPVRGRGRHQEREGFRIRELLEGGPLLVLQLEVDHGPAAV